MTPKHKGSKRTRKEWALHWRSLAKRYLFKFYLPRSLVRQQVERIAKSDEDAVLVESKRLREYP